MQDFSPGNNPWQDPVANEFPCISHLFPVEPDCLLSTVRTPGLWLSGTPLLVWYETILELESRESHEDISYLIEMAQIAYISSTGESTSLKKVTHCCKVKETVSPWVYDKMFLSSRYIKQWGGNCSCVCQPQSLRHFCRPLRKPSILCQERSCGRPWGAWVWTHGLCVSSRACTTMHRAVCGSMVNTVRSLAWEFVCIRALSLAHCSSSWCWKANPCKFHTGVPWQLLYADDLVLIADTQKECISCSSVLFSQQKYMMKFTIFM